MRASDETFYNIKRLHVVFAVSSLALLAVTVWMVAADHFRQWKVYQRTYLDRVEPWLTEARIREQRTADFAAREEQLARALDEAHAAVPARGLIERFCEQVRRDAAERGAEVGPNVAGIESAYEALVVEPGPPARRLLLARLDELVAAAKLRQENVGRRLQFRRARFDEARTSYEVGVGEGLSQAELEKLQRRVDEVKQEVKRLATLSERASAHYHSLTAIRSEITRPEDAAREALAEHRAAVARLERALEKQRPNWAKRLLRLPLVDAFGRPLAIDQIWLPDLTIDYNFCRVARFDRCGTCHQAVDKNAPGSAFDPACPAEKVLTLELATPPEPPQPKGDAEGGTGQPTLESVYGLSLAPRGILEQEAATVGLVLPQTPAADAQLEVGDVVLKINDTRIADRAEAARYLMEEVEWGRPLVLEIRRGLPHPFSSHPRLELFVGSLSPHPVVDFGCTICHGGQGSATEFKFASHTPDNLRQRAAWREEYGWFWNEHWDFPMLPKRFLQSSCLKCHHDVTDLAPSERFPDPPAAKLLAGYDLVRRNGCFGCHEISGVTSSGERTGPDMRLEPNYSEAAEERLPGSMRKVGPSLRDVAGKLDALFLDAWTRDPQAIRPNTRMPQFYGMHEHLDGKGLEDAKRFEAVEIRSVTEYLLAASQPVDPLGSPPEVTEPPSADRGRRLFQIHGCLACHKHEEFPAGESTFGPDLTGLGSKLTTEKGARWLSSWIRDPVRHSPRTLMPNALLEPARPAGAENHGEAGASGGQETGPPLTDPAADIAAFLLASHGRKTGERPPLVEADLDELALMHLSATYPRTVAQKYLEEGIPESMADEVQPDAAELLGPITLEKKIRYVGRRTIRKRGCYGCHDIPGFEEAQPIGPALSAWGRKQESLLAFEQVHQFLAHSAAARSNRPDRHGVDDGQHGPGAEADSDRAFYEQAVRSHRREGFIWQKLRAPRSFDYKKTENKGYNERLTMGRFSLTDAEREAIITFVLGLVAEPPSEKYVYRPGRRRKAIVEGRRVLDKYGCAQCHTLRLERWTFEYDPAEFEPPLSLPDYEFLEPKFTPEEVAASLRTDRRGLGHAEVAGTPRVDASGALLEDVDYDDNPLYFFTLWEPTVINGQICTVGGSDVAISAPQITGKRPPWGGDFARLLFPVVVEEARAAGSSAAEMEAWGWVPPPLVAEGRKVQPAWLYDYLLEPSTIRPAAVLKMPKYNLSPAEAGKLVDYFAAASGADFPYSRQPGRRSTRREADVPEQSGRLDAAMRLVTDAKTYCAKCHLIGDLSPGGEIRTVLAPNLEQVGTRIRPEFLRRWLANPKVELPYTAMPVNFPPTGEPLDREAYAADSIEQLEAVTDLLLDYDGYIKRRTSIQDLIESSEATESTAAEEE